MQLFAGFLLALLIAWLAYRLHMLTQDGALAAILVGTVIFGVGGWRWAVLLLTFFSSSSLLTRAFRKRKQGLDEKFSKGGRRDAGQVFGNGGLAALFAALNAVFPDGAWPWLGFAAALAAVNADTWATELGVLNPGPPRLITDLKRSVEQGTSGGISLFGTLAAFAGAVLIGVPAAVLSPSGTEWNLAILVSLAGLAGSLVDSLIGATVQAMYYCPWDQKETEKHPLHSCGAPTTHLRGWTWLDNDRVNFACSASGAMIALIFFMAVP